jgi:hypothetical protein
MWSPLAIRGQVLALEACDASRSSVRISDTLVASRFFTASVFDG